MEKKVRWNGNKTAISFKLTLHSIHRWNWINSNAVFYSSHYELTIHYSFNCQWGWLIPPSHYW